MNYLTSLMLFLACSSTLAQVPASESRKIVLPSSLREVLPKIFPGYRLVGISDYSKDDIDRYKKNTKGNSCLWAASSDVDGDGFPDFAFFITNEAQDSTLVVIARNISGKRWDLSKLYDAHHGGPRALYVDTLKSGFYRNMECIEKDVDFSADPDKLFPPGNKSVLRFKARYSGFIAGKLESTGIAFFFTGKHWVHLWLSD